MQATVATFDETTRSGHVLTDQGEQLDYTADALADHIRHLRLGQRVFLEAGPDGITSVAIWQP
ncbi:hypothetical protein [Aeromicrobium sp. UC242_57]|uniref:hypothetical protein n=1 Tax=Aeromicrobium sp. UC242_57 TaxID=3374624 RepID=UPI003789C1C5